MSYPVDRRRFVLNLVAAKAALAVGTASALVPGTPERSGWVLIGNHDAQGVFRARWDAGTGELGPAELAVPTTGPSYLTRHPHLPVVYACNETAVPAAAVSAFALDAANASLRPLNSEPTQGSDPCFVSVDRTGRLLFAANYSGGSLATFRLDAHGQPAPAAAVFACSASQACGTPGPVKGRQEGPHLHCATLSPQNRFVLACDLGDDSILVFPLQPQAAQPLGAPARITARPGSGPRHLAFHPNGRWLYCIHELDCTVGLLHWNSAHPASTTYVDDGLVSIRPSTQPIDAPSTGAEVAVTRDGRFLYASTRSANLLTLFAINASDGRLQQLQQLPCGGKTPRFFALDPSERWLLCAHQDSDTITVFRRDTATGTLSPAGTYPAPNPQCLLWI